MPPSFFLTRYREAKLKAGDGASGPLDWTNSRGIYLSGRKPRGNVGAPGVFCRPKQNLTTVAPLKVVRALCK